MRALRYRLGLLGFVRAALDGWRGRLPAIEAGGDTPEPVKPETALSLREKDLKRQDYRAPALASFLASIGLRQAA